MFTFFKFLIFFLRLIFIFFYAPPPRAVPPRRLPPPPPPRFAYRYARRSMGRACSACALRAVRSAGSGRKMAAPGGGVEAAAAEEEEAAGPVLGRLEEEARRRRERLRALRQRTLQNKGSGERENKQLREDDEEEAVKHNFIRCLELMLRNTRDV
ncbi:coiled-coil domain-containing protein 12 isoform X2 [Strix uralensis]|uniref:coiled-coil domain-containing protein 12 isoform X2 n=1 Tax=Strix uralensis TaxID=36305 RepID=UPI003DA22264